VRILALTCALAVLALSGCSQRQPAAPPVPGPAAGPRAADLPPVGRFAGILPCSDCDGIRTELVLGANWEGLQLYHLRETFLGGPRNGRTVEREGHWATLRGVPDDEQAIVYQIDPDRAGQHRDFIVVDERRIRLLDDALQPIGEPLVRVDGR
jgi:hypothetical protein